MNSSADLLNELRIERQPQRTGGSGSSRHRWIAIAVPILVLTIALAVLWWMRPGTTQVDTATAADTHTGGAAAVASVLDASGYVVARRMATVSAKVPGKVLEVLIEEGQQVREGQVIARLDPVDAAHQQRLAQAQVAAAQSQSGQLQAQLHEAEARSRRLQQLATQQLVARADVDAAIAQRDALRAQLATTQRQREVAQAQARIAGQGVDNMVVRAPFDGVVIAKAAQVGEIVSPAAAGGGFTRTGIGTIVDMDSLEVEVDVGEAYIGRVQPGMPVEATLNAYPEWKIPAEVIAIIPTADRGKATVRVRIRLLELDARIVPDMGVRVSFLEAPMTDAQQPRSTGVRVPNEAIVQRDDAPHVWVVNSANTVQLRKVSLSSASSSTDALISTGLAAGERVVLNPPSTLEDGSRVRTR